MGLALDQDPAGSRGVGSAQMKALELRDLWWIKAVPFGQGLRGAWCACSLRCAAGGCASHAGGGQVL